MPGRPVNVSVVRRAAAFVLAGGVLMAPLTGCGSGEKSDVDLALKWGQRANISAPASPGSNVGRVGEHLVLAEAKITAMVVPFGRAKSLQDDRARVVLQVTKVSEDAPRPIGTIDLWCPDSLVRERAWQVGTPLVVRLLPDYTLYDVADR